MKVILQQDVKGQGKKGDLVELSDGYARNYLFPRKLAAEATPEAINAYNDRQKRDAARLERDKEAAKQLCEKLKTCHVKVTAKAGTGGRLFGSVTNAEVVEALNSQFDLSLEKHSVTLSEPIKQCGVHKAKAKLGFGISAEIEVEVVTAE